jgi:uncharacterized protein YjbI with pentapeptide repeats
MSKKYIEDEVFEKIDFSIKNIEKAEYENCTFKDCNFSSSDLSHISFTECTFDTCNLSTAKINLSSFKTVDFINCKLLGLHFEQCNDFLFAVSFTNCTLNLSSFYKRNMKKTTFTNCIIHEVDFTEVDLSASVFSECDLSNSIFENTNLEKVDLNTSYNYIIDPEKNKIKKAKFALNGLLGLLSKYDIVVE